MAINNINDTIAAIATPLGTGGVGAIRISGEKSFEIISKIFSTNIKEKTLPTFKASRIYHGWIINPENNHPVDEVIVLVFKTPNSYTGENVIEINCHGGINIVKNLLNIVIKNGARLAERGEFTKRAFLNKKLDLSKAEAVLDIIHARTDKFSEASAHNLAGKLAITINEIRQDILNLLSQIISAIDFPEDVHEPEYDYIGQEIKKTAEKLEKILETATSSNMMRQGIKLAIVGKPNVGKSSLFNALLNMERAIVTDIPGTTRDIIQETLDISGIPVTLIDTAGIRELENTHNSDYIESIGINISKKCINEADIVLYVTDLPNGENEDDRIIFDHIKNKNYIHAGTKKDLTEITQSSINASIIPVSSKTREGLKELKKAIENKVLCKDLMLESEFSTNLRQQESLNKAKFSLQKAFETTINHDLQDLISIDLKSALLSLGEITGEVVTDEILNNIFDNFCIGK
jgi:tRNA modification GTPase